MTSLESLALLIADLNNQVRALQTEAADLRAQLAALRPVDDHTERG